MNTVVFSSWNGKIVDTRKGTAPKGKKASKNNAAACPVPYEGMKMGALMGWNGLVVLDPKADIVSLRNPTSRKPGSCPAGNAPYA